MGLDPSRSEVGHFSHSIVNTWYQIDSGVYLLCSKTWTSTILRLTKLDISISCLGLADPIGLPCNELCAALQIRGYAAAGIAHGSTVGMVLTLLFLLILLSGRGLGSLVWISSSGVLPSGGSSLFLLFLVSGNHWGGSSKGPKPNCVESSASVGVAGATWDEEA